MNWTPEPWPKVGLPNPMIISSEDYDRAVECVNALAGIADPTATLKGIYNALAEIMREGTTLQFFSGDNPEYHAKRIRQIARAAAKSLGTNYYDPADPVQGSAPPEVEYSQEVTAETLHKLRSIRTIAEHQFKETTRISNATALRMIENVANVALREAGVQEPALPTEQP